MNKIKYLLIIIPLHIVFGAYLKNIPTTLTQPDGKHFSCFASGDEFYHYLHTEDGYTIVEDKNDGYYYYAIKNNEILIPSKWKVNAINPKDAGIKKNLFIPFDEYKKKRDFYFKDIPKRDAPSIGTINNINIFIRFEDEDEFTNSRENYDVKFSKEDGPSLYHYYKEVSYDLLTVYTHHYPECSPDINISYQDQYPRSYYSPYNETTNQFGYQSDEEAGEREQILLKKAVEFIANEVPENLIIDSDEDGRVDNVTFLIKGVPDNWSDLLWPHRWALYLEEAYIHGKRVWDYNLNLADSPSYFTVGVLCHEFFHSLGAPDLYHYWDATSPVAVGGWDVMDASSDIPQYMSAYMKYRYTDWITDLPVIESSGIYELNPLSSSNQNIYRINSPVSDEYFVVEYRIKDGLYDINTPGIDNGLIIYRVNNTLEGYGNGDGPPDELYVYRQGGTLESSGIFSAAVFSELNGRTVFNDNTDPNPFLSDGSPGGINISNVGIPSETIQFEIMNLSLLPEFSVSYDTDGDNIINPGEDIILDLSMVNLSDINAQNVLVNISSIDENIIIQNGIIDFGNLFANNTINQDLIVDIKEDFVGILPSDALINFVVSADFDENNQNINYSENFELDLNISLNQIGFPYDTNSEVRSAPIVVDLDNDGNNEIVFADYFGSVRIIKDGLEINNGQFPYDIGDQIWGSVSSADIDLDGYEDFVVSSKNGHLYMFDINGLKADYDAERWLIATPVIGNIDNDPELEVIVGGYQSPTSTSPLFAVNHDGTSVEGFPYILGEKIKSGVALADMNGNGIDDIIFGTEDGNLYLLLDDLSIPEGFPFTADDKFLYSPVIVDDSEKKIIIIPCENNHIYGILDNGDLHFDINILSDIESSVSINTFQNNILFYINIDNYVKAYNLNGELIYDIDGVYKPVGSVIFSDLDVDGIAEMIIGDDSGYIYIYSLDDYTEHNLQIYNYFKLSSHLSVDDIDNDGDMEIVGGTTASLLVQDIKTLGDNSNYWNTYQGNLRRTGFYDTFCLIPGDLDGSSSLNIIDLIIFINIILETVDSGIYETCQIDFNDDGTINIFDLIILIEIILNA